MAAILFLWITGMFYMTLDSSIGSGMIKNLYLDTKIFTLSAYLSELESFDYGPLWPDSHLEYKKMLKLNFYPPRRKMTPGTLIMMDQVKKIL